MSDKHIDRDKSKAAIAKLIEDEKKKIKELEDRRKEREKEKHDTGDLDKEIENEKEKIAGKEEISGKDGGKGGIIDQFGQIDAVEEAITDEEKELKKKKDDVADLRKKASIPRSKEQQENIDKLDNEIRKLTKKIEGKEEAKKALVFD